MINRATELRVFYSYSHRDERFREQLDEHLTIFKRAGLIQSWSDRKILGGKDWRSEIDQNLEEADLVLLLVSSSFIASDYCMDKELALAMTRHESNKTRVVPIFVRPAEWQEAPFAGIQGLPKDALPVTQWENEDLAWQDIAAGIRRILEDIHDQKERTVGTNSTKTLQDAMLEDVERIDALYNSDNKVEIEGISTGFRDLDFLTNGLHKGELLVIASRPTMGKTSLALNIASAVAEQGLPVLIFSTKLSAREVSRRMLTSTARISYWAISTARLEDDGWPRLTGAIKSMNERTVLIDDTPSFTLPDLREKCIREKKKFGALALVLIDSVQYLNLKTEAIKETENTGRFLKSLARELDTTILVTSHVSRDVEIRPNKRPVLRDVEWPLGLTDEADGVILLYMDTHYNPDSIDRDTAELNIAKNQFGPLGTVRLLHYAKYGLFQSYTAPPL